MNKMEKYLEEHNYISKNKNKCPLRQQELSEQRAECISNKYNNLVEEKDKEIKRLQQRIDKAIELLEKENYHCPRSLTVEKAYIIEVEKITKVLSILKGEDNE